MQTRLLIQAARRCEAILIVTIIGSASMAGAAVGILPPLTSVHYRITTLSTPGGQFYNCFMNDNGVASATVFDAAGIGHGFVWLDGQGTVVNAPGAVGTTLNSVNNQGIACGTGAGGASLLYNVYDRTWTQVNLPPIPRLPNNFASQVTDRGLFVGVAFDANWVNAVGWIWDGKSYSFFTVPEASGPSGGTQPQTMNERGDITGFYYDALGTAHGFVRQGSTITTFDVPGADGTYPVGINNHRDIAGYYAVNTPATVDYYGFILRKGRFVTVDILGSTQCGMSTINDRGQLSGAYSDAAGNAYGFIATPEDDSEQMR